MREIILYSNVNIDNNSSNQSLDMLDISQYSDLSIYIDDNIAESGLSNETTIKKLYIDNINITSNSDMGTQVLNYKNPLNFGKYSNIQQPISGQIQFNVLTTNSQNSTADYNEPTFYTDCSNPITLGYLNSNIIQNYSISDETKIVSYNAKVLKEANINLNDINATLNFTIHIIDNSNRKYYCNMHVDINLDEDFLNNGYSYMKIPASDDEYMFFRE